MSSVGHTDDDQERRRILALMRTRSGVDFSDHRRETVRRGIECRVKATGVASLADYREFLESHTEELCRLAHALVVPVSAFFREPEVWEALQREVLPALAARPPPGGLRAWSVGVASGEEAWTLAMLLVSLGDAGALPIGQVLATDVDERSLARARAGQYHVADSVPPIWRERFFRRVGADLVVGAELRARVTFAQHDLIGPRLAPSEAIVAAFDLMAVRNVLIYFDARLRTKALERLRGVLRPGGVLVLGSFESLEGEALRGFRPYPGIREALRIYQRGD